MMPVSANAAADRRFRVNDVLERAGTKLAAVTPGG
jgi:hypothetical protein